MNLFNHDLSFWLTTIGAGVIRIILTPWVGFVKSIVSFASAIFFAVVFTDSVVAYLNLDPDIHKVGVTAIVALTGESIARWALSILDNPKEALEWFKVWKNGGTKNDKK